MVDEIVTIEDNESRQVIYNELYTSIEELDDVYAVDYDSIRTYDGFSYISEITDIDNYPISNVLDIFEKDGYEKNALSFYAYPYNIYRHKNDIRQIINKNVIKVVFLINGQDMYGI